MTDGTRDPKRFYCRWCPWSTFKFYRLKGGKVSPGWKRLRAHVVEKHEEEWEAIQRRLLEEGPPQSLG